jgi:hypothetical protein
MTDGLTDWLILISLTVVHLAKKFSTFMELKDNFPVNKNPLLEPTLLQLNPVHNLTPYLLKLHLKLASIYVDLPSGLFS